MNIPIDKYFKNRAVYKPDSKKYEIDEVDFDDLMELVKRKTKHLEKWDPLDRKVVSESW